MSRTRSRKTAETASVQTLSDGPAPSAKVEPITRKRTVRKPLVAAQPPVVETTLRLATEPAEVAPSPELVSNVLYVPTVKRKRRSVVASASRSFLDDHKGMLDSLLDPLVDPTVEERLKLIPTDLNEYGYDPWGLNPATARYGFTIFAWLYRHYWRVKTTGIDNVPTGRVLLIANHSGQIPIDGTMISLAMLLEADPPRIARAMVERWFTTLPVLGTMIGRMGSIVGDPVNCERLLKKGEAILVFPEGIRGSGKLYRDRYKLMRFGLGFMRLAIETNTPIVPIGVVGGEEQAPSLVDVKPLAKLLGMPYFPITPTFPWLGLLGMIPYPTKYYIRFGKPMTFRGSADDSDEAIQRKVDAVKRSIRELIDLGLEERNGIF